MKSIKSKKSKRILKFGAISLALIPVASSVLVSTSCGDKNPNNPSGHDFTQYVGKVGTLGNYAIGVFLDGNGFNNYVHSEAEYKNANNADKKAFWLFENINLGKALWDQIVKNQNALSRVDSILTMSKDGSIQTTETSIKEYLYQNFDVPGLDYNDENGGVSNFIKAINLMTGEDKVVLAQNVAKYINSQIDAINAENVSTNETVSQSYKDKLLSITVPDSNGNISDTQIIQMINYIFSGLFWQRIDQSYQQDWDLASAIDPQPSSISYLPYHIAQPAADPALGHFSTFYQRDKGMVDDYLFKELVPGLPLYQMDVNLTQFFQYYTNIITSTTNDANKKQIINGIEIINVFRQYLSDYGAETVPFPKINMLNASLSSPNTPKLYSISSGTFLTNLNSLAKATSEAMTSVGKITWVDMISPQTGGLYTILQDFFTQLMGEFFKLPPEQAVDAYIEFQTQWFKQIQAGIATILERHKFAPDSPDIKAVSAAITYPGAYAPSLNNPARFYGIGYLLLQTLETNIFS